MIHEKLINEITSVQCSFCFNYVLPVELDTKLDESIFRYRETRLVSSSVSHVFVPQLFKVVTNWRSPGSSTCQPLGMADRPSCILWNLLHHHTPCFTCQALEMANRHLALSGIFFIIRQDVLIHQSLELTGRPPGTCWMISSIITKDVSHKCHWLVHFKQPKINIGKMRTAVLDIALHHKTKSEKRNRQWVVICLW